MTMGAITGAITTIVGGSVTWLTSIVTYVTSSPLVLFFCLFSFVGIGIGLLMRFVNR